VEIRVEASSSAITHRGISAEQPAVAMRLYASTAASESY
jgi:hypothetical protein